MNYGHERSERTEPRPIVTCLPEPIHLESIERAVDAYFRSRELSWGLAKANGWYVSNQAGDPYTRIVIPASCSDGRLYWQARLLNDTPGALRYQSPYTDRFDAVICVFPFSTAREAGLDKAVAVCEGPFDALAAVETGCVQEAVALMGNNPGPQVWERLIDLIEPYRKVFLLADSDALYEAARWMAKLSATRKHVYVISSAPFKDFAKAPREIRRRRLADKFKADKTS